MLFKNLDDVVHKLFNAGGIPIWMRRIVEVASQGFRLSGTDGVGD